MSYLYLSEPKTVEIIEKWCVPEDYDYVFKFKTKQRQKQSLAGRCLVRMLYYYFWDTEMGDLKILVDGNGQPSIRSPLQPKSIWMSISHSNDFVCAVLSDQSSIGIDVEYRKANRDIVQLVGQIYPKFEGDETAAYEFWTINEAYGKAKGTGVDFSQADKIYEALRSDDNSSAYYAFKSMMVEDYIISVYCL